MARTKAEVRKFLDSQVGQSVNAKSQPYQGQCVSLVKALLEFLGAPNPYQARGNAKDVGDTLLRQNIAENGDGWLRVVVNRNMGVIGGVRYGHIWVDLKNETNYEQNGNRALHTTKGTRPYSQRQQVVNLDKYIKADAPKPAKKSVATIAKEVMDGKWGNGVDRKKALEKAGYSYAAVQGEVNKLVSKPAANKYVTVKSGWGLSNVAQAAGFGDAWSENRWAAIARLNGSSNWRTFNNRLKPGQKVRVK
jgi:hypothetical protein